MKTDLHLSGITVFFAAIISFLLSASISTGAQQSKGILFENGTICLAPSGTTIFSSKFDSADTWETKNYENWLALKFNQKTKGSDASLVISRLDVPGSETANAWTVTSQSIPLKTDQTQFVLRFVCGASYPIQVGWVSDSNWFGRILWFNAEGKSTGYTAIPFDLAVGNFREQIILAAKPAGSTSCRIRFGFDAMINLGESVTLCSVALEAIDMKKPFVTFGSFVSNIFKGGAISWNAQIPKRSAVKFQISTAPSIEETPGEFSPFSGPDGSGSYYEKPFETNAPFVRYKAFLVSEGTDAPTLKSVTIGETCDRGWTVHGDKVPPKIKIVSETPTENVRSNVSIEISDQSFINWKKTTIALDGVDATDRFVREKNRLTLTPQTDWKPGLHRLEINTSAVNGLSRKSTKYFYIGQKPTTPVVTLRDDGTTLIDGKPFFPIGIYGVTKCEFNGNNIEEAFRGLKKAGFNFAHSYTMPRSDEFLAAAEKYGFKLWSVARKPDERFLTVERHHPAIIAWYLGDDTASNTSPEELDDRNDAVRNTDGTRITTQADPVSSDQIVSNYFDYVRKTDSFLPEIYPIQKEGPDSGNFCVAMTIRDMEKCRSDIVQQQAAPKALWPIIQYFYGRSWKRFPTFDELYAMSFASIIHGANGITWFFYNDSIAPSNPAYYYSVTATPKHWQNISTLATRINSLIPVLLERTPTEQPKVILLDGPVTDPLNQRSVSCLMKRHKDAIYLLTVNAAPAAVTARFDFSAIGKNIPRKGDVLFENRKVTLEKDQLTESFAPLGVHIYKLQ